ncbi:NUDIX domain-containing protein [Arthrobacter sp. NEB 688]|uniref:NUDIX hydrolase n=1 Tax=Arthrobacter sp. NEB 688 TaxID=904039 RepID=UPI001C20534C|nr:NUDIX domain-containing protein [Arthrobacter sp. NEB 688]
MTSPLPGQPGFVVPAPEDRPRFERRAVRVLLLDENGRVLLLEDSDLGLDPAPHWWSTPGGGVDPGESDAQAVVRELWEETGLRVAETDLAGPVMARTVVHGWSDKVVDQAETFWVVRVPAFDVDTSGHTEEERMTVVAITWWDLDALAATGDLVWPVDLPALVALADRPQEWRDAPVDGGRVEESTVPLGPLI